MPTTENIHIPLTLNHQLCELHSESHSSVHGERSRNQNQEPDLVASPSGYNTEQVLATIVAHRMIVIKTSIIQTIQ